MRRGFAILLVVAFALMLAVAYGQEETEQPVQYKTVTELVTQPETVSPGTTMGSLPHSGGTAVGSILMPAAALLVGSGVLAFAVLRRR